MTEAGRENKEVERTAVKVREELERVLVGGIKKIRRKYHIHGHGYMVNGKIELGPRMIEILREALEPTPVSIVVKEWYDKYRIKRLERHGYIIKAGDMIQITEKGRRLLVLLT